MNIDYIVQKLFGSVNRVLCNNEFIVIYTVPKQTDEENMENEGTLRFIIINNID